MRKKGSVPFSVFVRKKGSVPFSVRFLKVDRKSGVFMLQRIFIVTFLAFYFAFPAAAAKRVALVIGNSSYSHVTSLSNPKNDATLMSVVLKETGFDVTLLYDLDQREMKKALLEFGRKLKDGAEASMFYYAGHGIEIDGINYLVPTNSDMKNKDEADAFNVSLNSFLAQMEGSGVPLNIVVLDSCRNNPFRSLRAVSNGGLAPVVAPSGTYIAYSTAPGSIAEDGSTSNSVFTEALAESIKTEGLSLESVFKQTRSKVQNATNGQQVPFDSSSIVGDFYFSVPQAVPGKSPVVRKEKAQKIADGLWVNKGASCKKAREQVSDEGGYIGIIDGPVRIFAIRKGQFYGLETSCEIISLDQVGNDLVSDEKCFGEGTEWSETRRFTVINSKEVILNKDITYTLCKP